MTSTATATDAAHLPRRTGQVDLTTLVTGLFAGGPAIPREGVSPAGAFQDSLYGRCILIDVRAPAERQRTGHVDPQLLSEMVVTGGVCEALTAAYQATLDHPGVPAHVLAADDAAARRVVTRLRWFGVPALHVEGGFQAWRSAGLPVLHAA